MAVVDIVMIALLLVLIVTLIRFATQLHRLSENNARLEATVDRMERATEVVAENLESSVSRADATVGPDGAAADAALRTGDSAAAIRKRQGLR